MSFDNSIKNNNDRVGIKKWENCKDWSSKNDGHTPSRQKSK
jgi:hypothetical protein